MNRRETDIHMVRTPEFSENYPENREITRDNIEKYIEGCEELAVRLDDIIEKVVDSGKRPVILIPSRGAVPIFLLARKFLSQLHDEGSYLAGRNARYFPKGIFDYLEGQNQILPDEKTTVDVILYPFTADVSLESTDDETIAKELRNSCARSVMQLVKGRAYGHYDYKWYKFLMKKLQENTSDPDYLKPPNIISSLDSFPPAENSQIIIIDTVISGRAAEDITRAFKTLGHTVIPLLAVDNTRGGKFQRARRHEIEETLRPIWPYLPEKGIFVNFPLLTEDKGSALLGVVALNFINFNKEGAFQQVSVQFDRDFRPQSCIWTLPPKPTRKTYLENFQNFINVAWSCRNGSPNPCTEQLIENLAKSSKPLTATHESPTYSEISQMVNNIDKEAEPKESASHIVSILLSQKQAEAWIKEFASHLSHSTP